MRRPLVFALALVPIITTTVTPTLPVRWGKRAGNARAGLVVRGWSHTGPSLKSVVISACRPVGSRLRAFAEVGQGGGLIAAPFTFGHPALLLPGAPALREGKCFREVYLENILLI